MQYRLAAALIMILMFCTGSMGMTPDAREPQENSDAYATILRAEAPFHALQESEPAIPEGSWVYVYRDMIPPGTTLSTWYATITLPDEPGWVVFIDEHPLENWGHACQYVFVNAFGDMVVYDAYGPPEHPEDWDRVYACQENLIAGYETDSGAFRCIGLGDRIIYWHRRVVDDAVIGGDFILYTFNRSTQTFITKEEHWQDDLTDVLASAISQNEAESIVKGRVESSQLYIMPPGSSECPIQALSCTSCWVVRSTVDGHREITVMDAGNGTVLAIYMSGSDNASAEIPDVQPTVTTTADIPHTGQDAVTPSPTGVQQVPGFGGVGIIFGVFAAIACFLKRN